MSVREAHDDRTRTGPANEGIDDVLARVNHECEWDCVVRGFDGYRLRLWSGSCPEYASPLAEFVGVSYMECAFEFSYPVFRLASASECSRIGGLVPLDADDILFAIDAETMARMEPMTFYVVANGLMPADVPELAAKPPA